MGFTEKFTTEKLIADDKTGKEEKKIIISNDAYAIGEELSKINRREDSK